MPRLRVPAAASRWFSPPPRAGGAAPATAPQAGSAFPVTITHAFGPTTIPAEPKRVVAVGFNEDDFVLALGVVPVGVRDFIGAYDANERPWAQARPRRTPARGRREQRHRPREGGGAEARSDQGDLLLHGPGHPRHTLEDRADRAQPSVDGAAARAAGLALGREVQAQHVVADTEKKFTDARAAPQLAAVLG